VHGFLITRQGAGTRCVSPRHNLPRKIWEQPMASVLPFMPGAVFDPDAIHIMGEAFDAAFRSLNDPGQPKIVREVIAKRIIEAARMGERNRDKLCEQALQGLRASLHPG
jgi:hypothetical protein